MQRRQLLTTAIGAGLLPALAKPFLIAGAPQKPITDPLLDDFLKQHAVVLKEYQDNNRRLTRDIAGRLAITTRTLAVYGVSKNIDGQLQAAMRQAIRDHGRNAVLVSESTDQALINEAKRYGLDISDELRTATPPDSSKREARLDAMLNGKMKVTDILNNAATTFEKARPKLVDIGRPSQLQKAVLECNRALDPCAYQVDAVNYAWDVMQFGCWIYPALCYFWIEAWLVSIVALNICRDLNPPC